MRPIITAAALAAIAATCTSTLAQPFIEITWEGTATGILSNELRTRFGGRVIFDAAAAPLVSSSSNVIFEAVASETYTAAASANPHAEPTYRPYDGSLRFDVPSGSLSISTTGLSISIHSPAWGFMAGMESLPDDPAAFADGDNSDVSVNANGNAVNWSPGSGFSFGTFQYWIREVGNPNPPEPCLADLDGSGILDLTDVNMFVNSFTAGCP